MSALAKVNLGALERNCARLLREVHSGGQLCAVVKSDGYGHGAVPCARAALSGGATWLAVARVEEARELRIAEVEERILVMGPLRPEELEEAIFLELDVVAWREQFVREVADIAAEMSRRGRVHVKLDTGMGRLGTRDSQRASRVVATAAEAPSVDLVGVMTHFATADEPQDDFFAEQQARFAGWALEVKGEHPQVLVHAANSAATLREPASHFDMVRCGIAIYGMDPFGEDPFARELEPALELSSYVSEVKRCRAGESTGYGRRFVADHDTHLGLLPIGYGDGWRRGLTNNADVLIGGARRPLVGTVSMDSVTVDLGADPAVRELRDQPAILLGEQNGERITAEEIARRLHTINYEITCGLTARVSRVHHHDGKVLIRGDYAEE
jgi:alanine racemase